MVIGDEGGGGRFAFETLIAVTAVGFLPCMLTLLLLVVAIQVESRLREQYPAQGPGQAPDLGTTVSAIMQALRYLVEPSGAQQAAPAAQETAPAQPAAAPAQPPSAGTSAAAATAAAAPAASSVRPSDGKQLQWLACTYLSPHAL